MRTVVPLTSNLVLTSRWHDHLRFGPAPLLRTIVGSRGKEIFRGNDAASSMTAVFIAFGS